MWLRRDSKRPSIPQKRALLLVRIIAIQMLGISMITIWIITIQPVYVYMCMCMYVCVYMYICMYVYILMYIYIYTYIYMNDNEMDHNKTARSRKDETRHGHWNTNRNPDWSKCMFLFKRAVWKGLKRLDSHTRVIFIGKQTWACHVTLIKDTWHVEQDTFMFACLVSGVSSVSTHGGDQT